MVTKYHLGLRDRVLQTYVVNFICQKMQNFQADSGYVGKINNIFFFKFFKKKSFQFLALPKDRQKFDEAAAACVHYLAGKKSINYRLGKCQILG